MQPFTVQCTTCRRSLRVTSPEAVGQILGCPKCGSMVMVEAPPEWSPGEAASTPTGGTPMLLSASTFIPPKQSQTPASTTPSSIAGGIASGAAASPKATAWKDPPPSATPVDEILPTGVGSRSRLASYRTDESSATSTPDPIAPQTTLTPVAAAGMEANSKIAADADAQPPAEPWPRWFLPGVATTVALGLVIFLLRLLLQSPETTPVSIAETPPSQSIVEPAASTTEQPAETPIATDAPTPSTDAPQNNVAAIDTDPSVAKPPAASPSTASETPPQNESPVAQSPPAEEPSTVATPLAQDVPPEPMPPGNTDIAKSDPAPSDQPPPAADAPQAPTLQRVPPRQVSLESRLADPIRGLDVRNMPLHQYLELLSELSTAPISLDLDALEQLGRSPTAPVTVQKRNATLAELFEAALGPIGLGYDLERGLVVVGHPQRETMRQVTYTLTDLAGDDAALGELAGAIRQLIAPPSWQQNGGKASMAAGSGKIVVEQAPAVHYKLLVLCEKLRVARGLPIKSKYDPAKFLLKTHEAKAHDLLAKPIRANFAQPQPLAGVVDWLRQQAKATILVDHAALADAETSAESHCSAVADGKPLAKLLDELLTPMELTWRVVDATTIEITTPAATAERDEIEFYPAKDLAADAAAGHALAEQLKTQLGPVAANPQLGVVIYFDAPSKSLIVRAPQRMQAQVESFLKSSRERK